MRHNWGIIQSIGFFIATAESFSNHRMRLRNVCLKTKRITLAFYGSYKSLHACLHDQNSQGNFAWW